MADRVSIVAFASAPNPERARGLLGWLTLEVDGLVLLDGVALRRTRGGGLALSFPARTDHRGRRRFCVRPIDDAARQAIEEAVMRAFGVAEVSP